jgi:hypothetical protein
VKTDAEGRVVRLTIYDNNLEGQLSPAICRLERCTPCTSLISATAAR